jgi:hypothetical protein
MRTVNDGYGNRECKKHGWQNINDCYYIHRRVKRNVIEYTCIKCSKESSIKNKDKLKEYKKRYNIEHKDVISKYQKLHAEKISNRRKKRRQDHLEEEFEYIRKYRINNNEKLHLQQKRRRDGVRLDVLGYYSPNLCCDICKENIYEFLALDHKFNNGAEHRRRCGSSFAVYLDIKNNNYPDGYRVLCHNCNLKYRDNTKCGNRKKKINPSNNIKAIRSRNYYGKNHAKVLEKNKQDIRQIKKEVIDNYGGRCACCGIDDIDVLSIDHIYGGGKAHCKEIGGGGHILYRWLKKNGCPKDKFRVLCMNCNRSLGSYGYCPHQKKEKENGTDNAYDGYV